MLNINDIIVELAERELCLKLTPSIAGQDTNFEEYYCKIVDSHGEILLSFDYHLDHYLHGGNIRMYTSSNPYGWFEKVYKIEDLLKHI